VRLKIRATRHGPLLSDIDPAIAAAAPGAALALSSTALRPDDRSMEAVWRVGAARDVAGVRAALSLADAPMQNVFFADVEGASAVMAAAKVPIRKSGDGFMPADGASGAQDWIGWIPTDALPYGATSPGGLLINANNRVVGAGYPHFISRDWDPSYRADRLEALLRTGKNDRVEDHLKAQLDIHSGMAERLLPLLLADVGKDPRALADAAMLKDWDRRMDRARPEPLIFAAWLRALGVALIAPATGEMTASVGGARAPLIERAFRGSGLWCAIETAPPLPRCRDIAETTLLSTLDQLSSRYGKDMASWRWGEAHQARHAHLLFGRIPVLRDLFDIVLPSDGGDDTINRGATARGGQGGDPGDFSHVHGAGYRAIYDLSDLSKSQVMIATGQSGHRLSPHYQDLARRWRDGETRLLSLSREALTKLNAQTLVLAPM